MTARACPSTDGRPGRPYGSPSVGGSGNGLAGVAALDVDSDHLGRTNRFGAEGLGQHRSELLGEEPVGVRLRLPQRDDAELAVAGGSDVARLHTVGGAVEL